MGTGGKIGETTLRPRGRGRAGSRAVSARGPGGEGAPALCGSALPRTRPRPAASGPAPHSALRRRSGLGAGGAELGKASLLPLGLCGPASRAGATPRASPRRARPERGHDAGQASAEPARSPAARLQPGHSPGARNAPPRLGWTCRAGLLPDAPEQLGESGEGHGNWAVREPCEVPPTASSLRARAIAGSQRLGQNTAAYLAKRRRRGVAEQLHLTAHVRGFQKKKNFFLTFAVLSSPKPKCLVQ